MHFSDLVTAVFQGIMLLFCVVAVIDQTCNRFMIFCVRPPEIWFKSQQARVDAVVLRFEETLAIAAVEGEKHYQSAQLRHALTDARVRFAPHETRLPWFAPRAFADEFEVHTNELIAHLDAALTYQQSPAFILEAAEQLRLARDNHPQRIAKHLEQIEGDFQQRLKRLIEAKEKAILEGHERHAEMAQSIDDQLGVVETTLQRLAAGTNISTI